MEPLYLKNVSPVPLVGYRQIWYSSRKGVIAPQDWIELSEDVINNAFWYPKIGGIQIGPKDFPTRYPTFPTISNSYLFMDTVVTTSRLKMEKDEILLKSTPKLIVDVVSRSEENILNLASRLKFPFEVTVSA